MRKIVLGAVVFLSFGASALAADYKRPVYKAPPAPPPPALSWNSFYFGVNAGYSFGRASNTVFAGTASAVDVGQNVNGWLGGVQAGYNLQLDKHWLVGFEADFQLTGERASRIVNGGTTRTTVPGGDFNIVTALAATNDARLPWFSTFRGRLGVIADPSFLLYATGGLAVGEVRYGTQNFITAQLFGPGAAGTIPAGAPVTVAGTAYDQRETRLGWTAGAGVEFKLSANWSGKIEYLYVDLGRATYFAGIAGTQTEVKFNDHIARVGVNYAIQ